MNGWRAAIPPSASWGWLAGAAGVWLVVAVTGAPGPPLPSGPYSGTVTLQTDVFAGPHGRWGLADIGSAVVLVEVEQRAGRGDQLNVDGTIRGVVGTAGGRPYRGILEVRSFHGQTPSRFWPHVAGQAVRDAVERGLEPYDPGKALLAGFLIGDTTRISAADRDAMRKSGLAHFVAVSGSNVALFLGILAVIAGPLALGPRRRAVVGLLGLPVYAAATGFEPSVLRASVMAAAALGGRLVGVVFEAWQLLALAVVVLVLADPSLTSNVGFQLSVAATSGVLVGARWPADGMLKRALKVTVGAQLAVAPLLLLHFGSVPLLSPVVNVIAAPLVTGATVLATIGVGGLSMAIGPADLLAESVLALARGASTWPQLNGWQFGFVALTGAAVTAVPILRPVVGSLGAAALAWAMIAPGSAIPAGGVAVLDVGQGDAILIHGGGGRYALVDGGPDAAILIDRLRTYGVTSLEVVVATHVHADHVTGLEGIVGEIPIGAVWLDNEPHGTPSFDEFLDALEAHDIAPSTPTRGQSLQLGELELTVAGPVRRYASPNDQSIVVLVRGRARTMLLSGDIETFAQDDLDDLRADVLKVPHQGAGTSDRDWLEEVGADLAVISVGPNQFGHPVTWVVDLLEDSGARVARTDEDGDVVVDLSREGCPVDGETPWRRSC